MNNESKIRIDLNCQKQIFVGWGTTLAWWGNAIGRWTDSKKRDQLMKLIFEPVEGLGLNIARYNIGGGENPLHNHMRVYADVPGFQPAPDRWDWKADAAQRWVLQKAKELGVNIIEAFSNAPPYWMTGNGCSAGASDGSSNLREECRDTFIEYLVEVVRHFRDHLDTTFDSLSPMNEPVRTWWKSTNNQEGCHFDVGEQEVIIGKLAEKLKEAGLEKIGISGPDENSIEETVASFTSYSENIKSRIMQLNTHTYEGKARQELKRLAVQYGKKLWVSEVTLGGIQQHDHADMSSALELAKRIIDDINELEPEAWIYWQAVEDEAGKCNHGLIHANFTGTQEYWLTKQYYTMGGFSRFIRPGYRIIESQNKNVLVAHDEGLKKIILVVVNDTSDEKAYRIDLQNCGSTGKGVEIYRTSSEENLGIVCKADWGSGSFSHNTKGNSITTIVIDGGISGSV